MSVTFQGGEEDEEQWLEPFPTDAIGRLPENDERLMDGLVVQSQALVPRSGRYSREPVEHANGVLAVVARECHKLIEDPTLLIRRNGPVPLADRLHQLL